MSRFTSRESTKSTASTRSFKGYKCKLGVAQGVSLIGDDFGTLTVTFSLQKDETITTPGKSQYFEMQQAD
jgi:hypothetical protein